MTAALDLPDIDCAPFTGSPCAYRGGAPARALTAVGEPVTRPADPRDRGIRLATVTVLCRPAQSRSAAPLRLTRRGVTVLATAVAVVGVALVWLAAASAPAPGSAAGSVPGPGAAHAVVVRAGDTLWSIATRVAPDRDPRVEVSALQRANSIPDSDVMPGQILRLP